MKNVLVTGANGFVGHHLVKELFEHDYTVFGLGSPGSEVTEQLKPYLENYQGLELTDQAIVDTIDFAHIDAVIHLAGLAAVGPSFDNPLLYVTVNVGIEINIYEACIKQGVTPKILTISSGSLYDPMAPLPLNESSRTLPNSPYAVSKLGQEQMAQYYSNRGFSSVIARPFNHVGPGQNEGFIVPDLAKQVVAAEQGEVSQIQVGNLEAKRDYTDVRDIARAYRLLIEQGESGETYNVCSGVSHSGQDILDTLLSLSGTSPEITQEPSRMRPSDTPNIYGDSSKLRDATGWSPSFDLRQTLVDALEDWRSR